MLKWTVSFGWFCSTVLSLTALFAGYTNHAPSTSILRPSYSFFKDDLIKKKFNFTLKTDAEWKPMSTRFTLHFQNLYGHCL
jgi:hypothetical protein